MDHFFKIFAYDFRDSSRGTHSMTAVSIPHGWFFMFLTPVRKKVINIQNSQMTRKYDQSHNRIEPDIPQISRHCPWEDPHPLLYINNVFVLNCSVQPITV